MNNDYFLYGLGFLAQMIFGLRMVSQWISSEKAGYSVSPSFFWKASLIASILFLIYGVLRTDPVIVLGQFLAYYLYVRNLHLKGDWLNASRSLRFISLILPPGIILSAFLMGHGSSWATWPMTKTWPAIFLTGLAGQLLLNVRFVFQWYYSERAGLSYFPRLFWILSGAGSLMVILYALHRRDPVLFMAQAMALLIYGRNIFLQQKAAQADII